MPDVPADDHDDQRSDDTDGRPGSHPTDPANRRTTADPGADAARSDDDLSPRLRPLLGRLGDAALPARSFHELTGQGSGRPAAKAQPLAGRRTLAGIGAIAALVAAVVGTVAVVNRGDDDTDAPDQVVAAGPDDDTLDAAELPPPLDDRSWERTAPSPLSARHRAVVAWTGTEVIVIGGDATPPCSALASCDGPIDVRADGAAYDPGSDTWRMITDAPLAVVAPSHEVGPTTHAALLGRSLFMLSAGIGDVGSYSGTRALLEYVLDDDTWIVHDLPRSGRDLTQLIGVTEPSTSAPEGAVVLIGRGTADLPDLVFDVATSDFAVLPSDPLTGRTIDRYALAVGRELVLFENRLADDPSQRDVARIARHDLDESRWTRGPDSEIATVGPWLVEGSRLINPTLGCTDGGTTDESGRCVPFGGIYDLETDTWAPLPEAPGAGPEDRSAGAVGSSGAVLLGEGLPAYDAARGTWFVLPEIDGTRGRSIVAIGADGFTFGGADDSQPRPEVMGDAWIWRSGRTPAGEPRDEVIPGTPGSAGTEPGDDPTEPLDIVARPGTDPLVRCADVDVGPMLLSVWDTPPLASTIDHPAVDALEAWLDDAGDPLPPEVGGLPGRPWLAPVVGDDRAVFVQRGDAVMTRLAFERSDGVWQLTSSGMSERNCPLRTDFPEGLGVVELELDPRRLPQPGDDVLHVLVTERSCASGEAPRDRLLDPQVVETDDQVLLGVAVVARPGPQECPGNPAVPITIELASPLGERTVADGTVLPAQVLGP